MMRKFWRDLQGNRIGSGRLREEGVEVDGGSSLMGENGFREGTSRRTKFALGEMGDERSDLSRRFVILRQR